MPHFFENAIPILNKYNFNATLFIVVSEMGNVSSWRTGNLNRQLMDWDELKEVARMGYSIGSHGLQHYDLTRVTQEDLDKEMINSKNIICEKLDIEVVDFSYPWGNCTEREINSVINADYSCAVTVGSRWHNGPETNRFLLERVLIEQGDSVSRFAKKINNFLF